MRSPLPRSWFSALSPRLTVFRAVFLIAMASTAGAQIFGAEGRLQNMKLLTQSTGWASTQHRLFWTADGGQSWKDITPHSAVLSNIASVFFVDGSIGWVLFSKYDESDWRFDLAATTDAGASWSSVKVNTSGLNPSGSNFGGSASMYFLDTKHGWINLSVTGSTAFHPGAAMATQDGGKTWNWIPMGCGSAGPIVFTTVNDGWVVGPEGAELYVTHDGSQKWSEVSVALPSELRIPDAIPIYDLPIFDDSKHGFLTVGYSNGNTGVSAQFTTDDGGNTWRFYRVLPALSEACYTIVQSAWIAASISKQQVLSTTELAFGASQSVTVNANVGKFAGLHRVGGPPGGGEMSFIDSSHGWLLAGALLSTLDGGATWTDITPKQAQGQPFGRVPGPSPRQKRISRNTAQDRSQPSAIPAVNTRVGFDRQFVLCTPSAACNTQASIGYMQQWWSSSPFFVTNLYLPGSGPNQRTDLNLAGANGPAWVSAIQQQGWGIIPTWVGKQPPCACQPNTGQYPNCTLFGDRIGPDVASAQSQGISEANAAASAATAIGVGNTIIYKDLENYNPPDILPNGLACGTVVNAFLSNWDQRVHADGYVAGAYGNPIPATDWWNNAGVSPKPDDVWIAKHDGRVTIWGLGEQYGFLDTYWNDNQRIHQFAEIKQPGVSYGGPPPFNVDDNTMDATIAGASASKDYNFTYQFSNAYLPFGINDRDEIVGIYQPVDHYVGFLYSNGVFGGIMCGVDTILNAINNQDQIVGWWDNGTSECPAFRGVRGLLYSQGVCTSVDYPGASSTALTGINDDGLIVGFAAFVNCDRHTVDNYGFEYDGTTFANIQPLDALPGTVLVTGINGDDEIVGWYVDQGHLGYGFVQRNNGDTKFAAENCTFAGAINNNGQVTGCETAQIPGAFIYDENNDSFFPLNQSDDLLYPGGINDATWIVGGQVEDFLATPY